MLVILTRVRTPSRYLAPGLLVLCLLIGWTTAAIADPGSALIGSAILGCGILAVIHPPFAFFALVAVAMNLFGFLDLDVEIAPDLKITDAAFGILFTILLFRRSMFRHDSSRFPFVARVLTPFGIMLTLVSLTILTTSLRWDQPLWLSVKGAKTFLYYSIAMLGGAIRLSDSEIQASIRWILLAASIASAVTIVGFFVPLDDVLVGARITLVERGGAAGIGYRTLIPDFAFIFLALFIAYHGSEFLRASERRLVLTLTTLATVCMAFRAFWAGIAVAVVVSSLSARLTVRSRRTRLATTALALFVLIGVLQATGGISLMVERISTVATDTESRAGSVFARIEQIRNLRPLIEQHPLLGVGFLHIQGSGAAIAALTRMPEVSTYDVGIVDLLLRFGFLGSLVIFSSLFMLYRAVAQYRPSALSEALRSYIVCGVVSLPGAAIYSWPGGIIPLAVAALLLASGNQPRPTTTSRDRILVDSEHTPGLAEQDS